MRSRSRHVLAPLVLAVALTVSACGAGQAEFEDPTGAESSDETDTETDPADDEPQTNAPPDGATPTEIDPDDVIEQITYPMPVYGVSEDSTITVGLHALRVEGSTMLLVLYFTPDVGEAEHGDSWNIFTMHGDMWLRPALNDRENLKQYLVLTDGDEPADQWSTVTNRAAPTVVSGQTTVWWGYFSAPQDDIDTISVAVVPGVVEFADIPIQR